MNALIGALIIIAAVLVGFILLAVAAGTIQKVQKESDDPKAFSAKGAVQALAGLGIILLGGAFGIAALNGVYLW